MGSKYTSKEGLDMDWIYYLIRVKLHFRIWSLQNLQLLIVYLLIKSISRFINNLNHVNKYWINFLNGMSSVKLLFYDILKLINA